MNLSRKCAEGCILSPQCDGTGCQQHAHELSGYATADWKREALGENLAKGRPELAPDGRELNYKEPSYEWRAK